MHELIEKIRSAVAYHMDSNGKVRQNRPQGASLDLPQIEEQETRRNTDALMAQLLSEASAETVIAHLKASVQFVKSYYTRAHDGFRVAKGTGKGRSITVGDLYAFSVAAGYCFDFLPEAERQTGTRIGIGVMAPAIQDCGKNLIKIVWKAAGYEVVDLGNTLQPERWLEEIGQRDLSLVGISCMTTKCIDNVHRLLSSMEEQSMNLPVIMGGIAANRAMAFNFSKTYGLPIYYGTDVGDAVEVLEKALSKRPVEIPTIKEVEEMGSPAEILKETNRHGFRLFRIRISDILMDEDAREGCSHCSGDKRRLCPLEIGYEKLKSLKESTGLVNNYGYAVLVFAEIPDETDRPKCKSMWQGLLRAEQYFAAVSNDAHAFKFPMTCPFCLPKECTLPKGKCTFESLYRPLHEQYNINVKKTLANVFGDGAPCGICSIILVR
jgi:methylmalonyl-CoA mutase cobalamin-binding subunit